MIAEADTSFATLQGQQLDYLFGHDVIQLNLHEAKAKLSECIEAALRGERVVIARRNVPAVELAPIPQRLKRKRGQAQLPEVHFPWSAWIESHAPVVEQFFRC